MGLTYVAGIQSSSTSVWPPVFQVQIGDHILQGGGVIDNELSGWQKSPPGGKPAQDHKRKQ